MNDRERIIELFARARPTYGRSEVLGLLGISDRQLAEAIDDGCVDVERNDCGAEVIRWEDVALLALEEWTPRMIEAALEHEKARLIPDLNQHRLIQVSLPKYLIRLLDHLARQESAVHHVPRNASDIIERVLHEFANSLDVPSIEVEIDGFQQALRYPYFLRLPSQIALRCRYCDIATTEAVREVCRGCVARHEPKEHLGEYGLPELDRESSPADAEGGGGEDAQDDRIDVPKIQTVRLVTMEHGAAFARGWYEGDITDACTATGIMTWPDNDDREAEGRYLDIEDAICHDVFEATKEQIAAAFVRVASTILNRERSRN
ncbi:MAG TPA: hypothetical protein VJ276_16215 [Thermoanaerobaculia bacterium]|nr:hypothetical protein [Thermoanaerobaculia bacterium]